MTLFEFREVEFREAKAQIDTGKYSYFSPDCSDNFPGSCSCPKRTWQRLILIDINRKSHEVLIQKGS
jgi:hypothetical protein